MYPSFSHAFPHPWTLGLDWGSCSRVYNTVMKSRALCIILITDLVLVPHLVLMMNSSEAFIGLRILPSLPTCCCFRVLTASHTCLKSFQLPKSSKPSHCLFMFALWLGFVASCWTIHDKNPKHVEIAWGRSQSLSSLVLWHVMALSGNPNRFEIASGWCFEPQFSEVLVAR